MGCKEKLPKTSDRSDRFDQPFRMSGLRGPTSPGRSDLDPPKGWTGQALRGDTSPSGLRLSRAALSHGAETSVLSMADVVQRVRVFSHRTLTA